MKILAIAVAMFVFCAAEVAVACPACNARVGQPMVVPTAPIYAPAGNFVSRPMRHHHHARRAQVPLAMPAMSAGCGSCGLSPYISRPAASCCGAPMSFGCTGFSMASYGMGGCGSSACGSSACGSTGMMSTGYGGTSMGGYGPGKRYCVQVPGPNGQMVTRCYRLIPVPRGTPGAIPYSQVISSFPFAGTGAGSYGAGAGMTY